MRPAICILGKRFGRMLVVDRAESRKGQAYWVCKCDCGTLKEVKGNYLRSGRTQSCGCLQKELVSKSKTVHGKYQSVVHNCWTYIKAKTSPSNVNSTEKLCRLGLEKDWNYFENFYKDMGDPPDSLNSWAIERISTEKGYVRGNCRWVTKEQQAKNRVLPSTNKTGIMGVCYYVNKKTRIPCWIASYRLNGKLKSKSFSVNKYGEELAFFLACEYKELMAERLKLIKWE